MEILHIKFNEPTKRACMYLISCKQMDDHIKLNGRLCHERVRLGDTTSPKGEMSISHLTSRGRWEVRGGIWILYDSVKVKTESMDRGGKVHEGRASRMYAVIAAVIHGGLYWFSTPQKERGWEREWLLVLHEPLSPSGIKPFNTNYTFCTIYLGTQNIAAASP